MLGKSRGQCVCKGQREGWLLVDPARTAASQKPKKELAKTPPFHLQEQSWTMPPMQRGRKALRSQRPGSLVSARQPDPPAARLSAGGGGEEEAGPVEGAGSAAETQVPQPRNSCPVPGRVPAATDGHASETQSGVRLVLRACPQEPVILIIPRDVAQGLPWTPPLHPTAGPGLLLGKAHWPSPRPSSSSNPTALPTELP